MGDGEEWGAGEEKEEEERENKEEDNCYQGNS